MGINLYGGSGGFHNMVQPTDKAFPDSPPPGDPNCICSRCGKQIPEDEILVRAWPSTLMGVPEGTEYRYCEVCQASIRTAEKAHWSRTTGRYEEQRPDRYEEQRPENLIREFIIKLTGLTPLEEETPVGFDLVLGDNTYGIVVGFHKGVDAEGVRYAAYTQLLEVLAHAMRDREKFNAWMVNMKKRQHERSKHS